MVKSPKESNTGVADRARYVALVRARHVASGLVSSGIVHEFANLLTVFDGIRQVRQLRNEASPDLDRMIEEPVERSRQLIDAYRHVFADSWAAPATAVASASIRADISAVALLTRTRLRGRSTRVEFESPDAADAIDAARSVPLRVVLLLATLAIIEEGKANDLAPVEIRIRGEIGPGESFGATIAARFGSPPAENSSHPSTGLAREAWSEAEAVVQAFAASLRRSVDGPLVRCSVHSGPPRADA